MNAPQQGLSLHPAPHADRVNSFEGLFGLFGGPLAWYLQLCAGYAMASAPCIRAGSRMSAPLSTLQWTWLVMILSTTAAFAIALFALLVSWRIFRRTKEEAAGGTAQLIEVGAGRTRFLALWGVLLSIGFALATAITALAFPMLPRCAG